MNRLALPRVGRKLPTTTSRALLAAAVAGVVVLASACGSSSTPAASGPGNQTLSIALADKLGDIVSAIAQQKGYFAQQHVTVNLVAAANNTPTFVTSGQSDLAEITFVPALSAAEKGQSTTVIYATNGGANGSALFAKPGTTLDSIKNNSGCKIATVAQGTATYGFAQIYKQTAGLNCQTVTLSNAAAQEAALASGQVQGFITTPQYLGASLAKSNLQILIDSRKPGDLAKYGGQYVNAPGVGFWGLTSHLASKKTAIESFLKAWNKARLDVLNDPNGAVDTLMKTDLFKGDDRSVPQASVTALRAWLGTLTGNNGFVTSDQWTQFLHQAASYGLANFNVNDPAFAYQKRVDMSYYTDALGQPAS
ncbi:MAG TPA: ABC transporter substrate-binding protein [Pseudonocardiaceae bacterium]|jgi:ABC-type nitrate/sulfonate/bicarbonate transport system substrate-binding protein